MKNAVKATSIDDLYDALSEAMDSVRIARDTLKSVPEYVGWRVLLDEVYHEMKAEFDPLNVRISEREAKELEALTREYWESVI